jgi:hypothetical protein
MEMADVSETDAEDVSAPQDSWQIPVNEVWYLDQSSWPFHRSVWRTIGRCLEYGEYAHLKRQIRKGEAEQLGDRGGLYRVALRDGTLIKVVVATWSSKRTGPQVRYYNLLRVWYPGRAESSAPKETPPTAVPEPPGCPWIASTPPPEPPVAPSPPPPPPPSPPVLRASTLTLGSKAGSAAELLADRLRPTPLPPRAEKPIVPKKKQTRR